MLAGLEDENTLHQEDVTYYGETCLHCAFLAFGDQ